MAGYATYNNQNAKQTQIVYPNSLLNYGINNSNYSLNTNNSYSSNDIDSNLQEIISRINSSTSTPVNNGTQITEQQALAWDELKSRENLANKYIGLKQDQLNLNRDMGIASGFFQGLGSTVNAGLGIWGAIESAKNAKKSRELMDKQIANYNEQIEASREARQQRRDELARLSKMRSNTKAQFNTQASVTRSY